MWVFGVAEVEVGLGKVIGHGSVMVAGSCPAVREEEDRGLGGRGTRRISLTSQNTEPFESIN